MKFIVSISLAILTIACTAQRGVQDRQNSSQVTEKKLFELSFSNGLHSYKRDNGSWAYFNFDNKKYKRDPGDLLVEVYDSDHTPEMQLDCDNSLLNSKIIEKNNDFYTLIGKPIPIPCEVDKCHDTSGYAQYAGRYILCSKHKGKTVRIEVSQVTDNPALAEEIFKTFKWTK